MMHNCPYCDVVAELVVEDREVRMGKRSIVVPHEFIRCPECGEEFFVEDQLDRVQYAAAAGIREVEGLLPPAEVREIRERLGLSQAALEKLLGVGPKTVVRWETGRVFQNRATDTLLRVIDRFPKVARYLAAERDVELPWWYDGDVRFVDLALTGGAIVEFKSIPNWGQPAAGIVFHGGSHFRYERFGAEWKPATLNRAEDPSGEGGEAVLRQTAKLTAEEAAA